MAKFKETMHRFQEIADQSELAELLGVSTEEIDGMIGDGDLPEPHQFDDVAGWVVGEFTFCPLSSGMDQEMFDAARTVEDVPWRVDIEALADLVKQRQRETAITAGVLGKRAHDDIDKINIDGKAHGTDEEQTTHANR